MRTRGLAREWLVAMLAALVASPVAAVDSDDDGLSDGFEKRYGVTSHLAWDSDGDGVIDSAEDLDGDKLSNLAEQRYGTHPQKRDTDGDGIGDGAEDADRDGRSNAREQDRRPVPGGLTPTLLDASWDRQPDKGRCQAVHGSSRVRSCTFGDPGSDTTLVLVGDSHATMYLTPWKRIARARGWRLVTMTKAACPAFLGLHGALQYELDEGASCRRWRRNVIDRLQAQRPDYVVFEHADYRLKTVQGVNVPPDRRPEVWRKAVKRTLRQLPASTRALVMGRVPANRTHPVKCLRRYPKDLSRCTTKRIPSGQRRIDKAIRTGAAQGGGAYATLHPKICSYSPCPVVQGKVMMWRDGGHVTETFAKLMQPSLARILERKLVDAP
jgi:hypothetical protein